MTGAEDDRWRLEVIEPGRLRAAGAVDAVAGLLLAVLLYPFPILRAALPLPVFVGTIVLSIVAAHFALVVVTVVGSGRTPGMFLFGLALSERPGVARAVAWAAGWVTAFVPGLVYEGPLGAVHGWPARLSGIQIARTGDR